MSKRLLLMFGATILGFVACRRAKSAYQAMEIENHRRLAMATLYNEDPSRSLLWSMRLTNQVRALIRRYIP